MALLQTDFPKRFPAYIQWIQKNLFPAIGSQSATSAAVTTNPTHYEDIELQPPTTFTAEEDHMHDGVELRAITTQQKEIEVAPNDAYGTVWR